MQKTIKINSKEKFTVDNNAAWTLIYNNQFGHDIIPDVMPILSSFFELVGGLDIRINDSGEVDIPKALKSVNIDEWDAAFIKLSGLEFTTLINIAWAMAKCADEDIPQPMDWVKSFSVFPVDVIAPSLFKVLADGLVSSKNLKRLQGMIPQPQTKETK